MSNTRYHFIFIIPSIILVWLVGTILMNRNHQALLQDNSYQVQKIFEIERISESIKTTTTTIPVTTTSTTSKPQNPLFSKIYVKSRLPIDYTKLYTKNKALTCTMTPLKITPTEALKKKSTFNMCPFQWSESRWIIVAFSSIEYITQAKIWYKQLTNLGYNYHHIVSLDLKTYQILTKNNTYRVISGFQGYLPREKGLKIEQK